MKKLLAMSLLAVCSHHAFEQVESFDGIFHTGKESEKVAESMMQEVMMSVMTAAMANGGKEIDEKEVAQKMFQGMSKHAEPLKAAMQKDCAAEEDAKACACFYDQVDLKEMFSALERAVVNAKSEEDVDKLMRPYMEGVEAKKAQCKLD